MRKGSTLPGEEMIDIYTQIYCFHLFEQPAYPQIYFILNSCILDQDLLATVGIRNFILCDSLNANKCWMRHVPWLSRGDTDMFPHKSHKLIRIPLMKSNGNKQETHPVRFKTNTLKHSVTVLNCSVYFVKMSVENILLREKCVQDELYHMKS